MYIIFMPGGHIDIEGGACTQTAGRRLNIAGLEIRQSSAVNILIQIKDLDVSTAMWTL